MIYLKTTETQGHPFDLGDIGFLQDAFKDALKGFLKGFAAASETFIITGCELTVVGSDTILQPGWVCINGEVCEVDGYNFGSAGFTGGAPYWTTNDVVISPSPVLYEDLSSKGVHLKRKGVLVGANTGGLVSYGNTKRFVDILREAMYVSEATFTLQNSWVFGNLPLPNAGYRKEARRVYFHGDIRFAGGAVPLTNAPFAVLPVGLRPVKNRFFIVLTGSSWNSSTSDNYLYGEGFSWVRVDTDGNCYANPVEGNSISLDGISFDV